MSLENFYSKHFIRIILIVLCILLIYPLQHFSFFHHQKGIFYTENDSTVSMTVIFAGDAMVHSTQYKSAYIDSLDAYNFNPVFQYIRPILAESDLNVVNLETTLGDRPFSGFPNFSSPDAFAHALKLAGFNYFALANNHCVDKGRNGIIRTLDVLDEYGIKSTGTFRDSTDRASRYPEIMEINNIKTTVLNYTYGTNGINVPEPLIVNLIDTTQIQQDIQEARLKGAEVVMVYFHWGNEYERKPNIHQKRIAELTFKNGADIIIGSHPHVVQPIELFEYEKDSITTKKWVAWSLGNFVSNQRDKYTDGGIMIKFKINKNIYNNNISISDMTYIPYWVHRPLNPTRYFVLPVSSSVNTDSIYVLNNSEKNELLFISNAIKEQLKKDSLPLTEW